VIAAGAVRYQRRPCLRGHAGERFTNGGECVEFSRLKSAADRDRVYPKWRGVAKSREGAILAGYPTTSRVCLASADTWPRVA